MADVLIRGLDEELVAAYDAEAARRGLSRNEVLRRHLAAVAPSGAPLSAEDWARHDATFADARDDALMEQMWRDRRPG